MIIKLTKSNRFLVIFLLVVGLFSVDLGYSQSCPTVTRVDVTPQPASTSVTFVAVGSGIEYVFVRILDSTGTQRIFNGTWTVGNSFTWNLRDDRGNLVADGTYRYIMWVYAKNCNVTEAGRGTFVVNRSVGCFDSDGRDIFTKGRTTNATGTYEDRCFNPVTVIEYVCNGNIVMDLYETCPISYWCVDGACVYSPGGPPITTTTTTTTSTSSLPQGCVEFSITPTSGSTGQTFNIRVTGEDSQAASMIYVGIKLGSSTTRWYGFYCPNLARCSHTFSFIPTTPGTYNVTAWVYRRSQSGYVQCGNQTISVTGNSISVDQNTQCREFRVSSQNIRVNEPINITVIGYDPDGLVSLWYGICRDNLGCSNPEWVRMANISNSTIEYFGAIVSRTFNEPGTYYIYGVVRGYVPGVNETWCNNGQPYEIRVGGTTTTTTTTTIVGACQFLNCEAPNPPGCFCGAGITTQNLVWCCARFSFVTDSPQQCQNVCSFIPTTTPTPTTIPTSTSIPAQTSCRGRCNQYNPNAPCQCDLQCHIHRDCCPDICRECPTHPGCASSTTTTSTTTTTTTTSTISSTNTTTSSTTTTSTTSTTTTTTSLPEVKLTCNKDKIFVGESLTCNIENCNNGIWFVISADGSPLESPILSNIPPNQINIGPILNEGKIRVLGICKSPSTTVMKEVIIEKGISINCSECNVDSVCICEIRNCTYGLLLATNSKGSPLSEDISRVIPATPYYLTFKPIREGEILINLECYSPYKIFKTENVVIKPICSGNISLNITPSIVASSAITRAYVSGLQYCEEKNVTIRKDSCNGEIACVAKANENCQFTVPSIEGNYTYFACVDKNNDNDYNDAGEQASASIVVKKVEERFKILDISCTPSTCKIKVENSISEPVLVYITLIAQPEGRIYYASNVEFSPFRSGEKETSIINVKRCPQGTQLQIVAIAMKFSDINNQLDKFSKQSFVC